MLYPCVSDVRDGAGCRESCSSSSSSYGGTKIVSFYYISRNGKNLKLIKLDGRSSHMSRGSPKECEPALISPSQSLQISVAVHRPSHSKSL